MQHLELLVNFLADHFLRKNNWQHVSKMEWNFVAHEINELIINRHKKQKIKYAAALLGENYLYEHLIIKRLKATRSVKTLQKVSAPSFTKINMIVQALGYANYTEFIDAHSKKFSFSDLKISIPNEPVNTALLDTLVGFWYSYNRNLPDEPRKNKEERIWRSAVEIYKSATSDEYLLERSGSGYHKYYGKVTAYADYIFIIVNSNTFIRQRHFIARLKDINEKLRRPGYALHEVHFVSTCISFNKEPIALFEIFERVTNMRKYVSASIDFPIDSDELPVSIVRQLKDTQKNRINHR